MSQINSLNDPRLPERFWKKIDASQSDCWLWTGALKRAVQQYGFYHHEGKTQIAHRVARLSTTARLTTEADLTVKNAQPRSRLPCGTAYSLTTLRTLERLPSD